MEISLRSANHAVPIVFPVTKRVDVLNADVLSNLMPKTMNAPVKAKYRMDGAYSAQLALFTTPLQNSVSLVVPIAPDVTNLVPA